MPLYEYKCLRCGHRFELIRKFSDRPVTACIKCGGKVEKLVSSSSIAFKGSGWYVTDYGGKSGGKETGKDEPKADSGSESKSDKKKESGTAESVDSSPKDKDDKDKKKKKSKS